MGTPKTNPARQYRFTCADYTSQPCTLERATRRVEQVEKLSACCGGPVVEVLDEATGTWHVSAEWLAPRILDARLGQEVRTFDGHLILTRGGWSKEAGDRADATAEPGSDAWKAALGRREYAVLTADGRGDGQGFCRCADQPPAEQWVRYERWTADGRAAHGYLCPSCRGITQTG